MSTAEIRALVIKNKWSVAAALIIVAAYTIGKDMALRDNVRDAAQHSSGAQQ